MVKSPSGGKNPNKQAKQNKKPASLCANTHSILFIHRKLHSATSLIFHSNNSPLTQLSFPKKQLTTHTALSSKATAHHSHSSLFESNNSPLTQLFFPMQQLTTHTAIFSKATTHHSHSSLFQSNNSPFYTPRHCDSDVLLYVRSVGLNRHLFVRALNGA